jgi:hypothetical protein
VPDEDGFYGTRQIVEVLYGSIYAEQLKTQKELTRRLALQNLATTAAMLNRAGRRPARYGLLAFSTDEAAWMARFFPLTSNRARSPVVLSPSDR